MENYVLILRTKLAQIGEDNSKISMENDKNLVVIPWKEYDTEKQEVTTDYSITNTNKVFTNGSGYLTVNIPYNNVNIIIPEGANIFQDNVIFNVTGNNVNLIVRGTLDNTKNNGQYCNSLFYFHQNANILIGATATINFNNEGHDPLFFLGGKTGNIVLYPGCKINTIGDDKTRYTIAATLKAESCRLWLNKYSTDNDEFEVCQEDYKLIKGNIHRKIKIMFPTHINVDDIGSFSNDNEMFYKRFNDLEWQSMNYKLRRVHAASFTEYDNCLTDRKKVTDETENKNI